MKIKSIVIILLLCLIILPGAVCALEDEINQDPGKEDSTPAETPSPVVSSGQADETFKQGLKLYYQKRFDDAVDMFEEALNQDPLNTMALSFYLAASYKQNKLVQAVNNLEKKAMEGGNTPILKAHVGIGYFSRGKIDQGMIEEARNMLKDALKENPDLSIANTGMGMIYFQKRLIPRAKGYFIKALKANNRDMMAMELLGNILMIDEKKSDAALDFFLQLIQMCPEYSDGWFMAGSAYQRMDNITEAVKYFKNCMTVDPLGVMQGYNAPLRIGDIFLKEKDYKQAEEYYKQALVINPDNPYAKTQLEKAKGQGKEWKGEKVNPLKDKITE